MFSHKNQDKDEYKYNIEEGNRSIANPSEFTGQRNDESSFAYANTPSENKAVPEARNSFGSKLNEVPQFTKTSLSNINVKNNRKPRTNYLGSNTVNDEIEEENEFEEENKIAINRQEGVSGDTGGMNFQFQGTSQFSKDSSVILDNVKSKSSIKRKTINNLDLPLSSQNTQYSNQNIFANQVQKMPVFSNGNLTGDVYNYDQKFED